MDDIFALVLFSLPFLIYLLGKYTFTLLVRNILTTVLILRSCRIDSVDHLLSSYIFYLLSVPIPCSGFISPRMASFIQKI
jgi:hypothetical protein